ncbi:MAG TPA: SUMF1/EgtB/PvdO family nonheme iron enzyme, partial [Polyangiaceae bacterium]
MSRVSRRRQHVTAVVLLNAITACVRFGYDVNELSTREGAVDAGGTFGALGTVGGSNAQVGGFTSAGAGSATSPTLTGGATNAVGGGGGNVVVPSSAGGFLGQQGGARSAGTNGFATVPVGGSNYLSTTGTALTSPGGTNSGGNASTAVTSATGTAGSLTTSQGGMRSGGAGGATHSTGAAGIGGRTGPGPTSIGGTSGMAGSGQVGGAGNTGSNEPVGPSCSTALDCGQASCCNSIRVAGGTYNRGVSPTYAATIDDFYLDKYEVTVGRFRAFLGAYDAWRSLFHPNANDGVHEHPTIIGSGWNNAWNPNLPANAEAFADSQHLGYCGTKSTWTATVGTTSENYPINCVTWYEAFAFCIWDGARLATEAEWQYVAGGGSENRRYPWGST